MRMKLLITVGLVAAGAAYLHGWSWQVALTIAAGIPLLIAAAPHILTGMRTPTRRENPIEDMSGTEFEDYVARIARSCGVPVIMTAMTGDWGVDLIVGMRPNRLAIQCKRLKRPVGTSAVQEVVAGAPMQDCAHTMVVTNNDFTPAARKLAELHDCTLVDGTELPRLKSLIRQLTQRTSADSAEPGSPPQ
ncbi:restriction system protein [Mycobacterium sp. OTB74]|nr:restriction system protein [Mycobacterium sp. OTB74]